MSSIARGYLAAQTLGRGIFPPLFWARPSQRAQQLRKAFLLFSHVDPAVSFGAAASVLWVKRKSARTEQEKGGNRWVHLLSMSFSFCSFQVGDGGPPVSAFKFLLEYSRRLRKSMAQTVLA